MLLSHMRQCREASRSQAVYISRLVCLPHLTQHPALRAAAKEEGNRNVWDRESRALQAAAAFARVLGQGGFLGLSSVAVTDLLSDLGNAFLP